MPRRTDHKKNIIRAAVKLFRRQGYAATGINEILDLAEAPKGSLYYYFPGGKEDITLAAIQTGGEEVTQALKQLLAEGLSGVAMVETMAGYLGQSLSDSNYQEGCPVATVLLETAPGLAQVTAAGRQAFADWQAVIHSALERDGFPPEQAERLAELALATIEGGLILARAAANSRPLVRSIESILPLFKKR